MGKNRIARALAQTVKARRLTALGVANTSAQAKLVMLIPLSGEGEMKAEAVRMFRCWWLEGVRDTAEAETKGSQSAVGEQTVFPLNSPFSLMKRIMSHHCSDGSHMPWA